MRTPNAYDRLQFGGCFAFCILIAITAPNLDAWMDRPLIESENIQAGQITRDWIPEFVESLKKFEGLGKSVPSGLFLDQVLQSHFASS